LLEATENNESPALETTTATETLPTASGNLWATAARSDLDIPPYAPPAAPHLEELLLLHPA
jgi:hypothetical protein